MTRALALSFCLGMAAVLAGCGGDDAAADDDGSGSGSGVTSGAGAGATSGAGAGSTSGPGSTGSGGSGAESLAWEPIITAEWELGPGSEKTSDIHSITIPEDIYVGAIRPIAPLGTHHTVLAVGGLGAGNVIYASGVDTNALVFPEGIGLKLKAGELLVLQLHLFNASPQPLTGLSGIEIVKVAPEDVQEEANLFLPGPMDLSIPPNQESSQTGTCTVNQQQTVFAIFPHMHQLGTHFKSTLTIGGVPQVIHDDSYSFNHQAFIPFEPTVLSVGDTVTTECTWDNNTTKTVTWGESSTTEMCFSILYRYPALTEGDAFGFCTH